MEEQLRGRDRSSGDASDHNKVSNGYTHQPGMEVSFNGMNYEQRRRPYNFNGGPVKNEEQDEDKESHNPGKRRDVH